MILVWFLPSILYFYKRIPGHPEYVVYDVAATTIYVVVSDAHMFVLDHGIDEFLILVLHSFYEILGSLFVCHVLLLYLVQKFSDILCGDIASKPPGEYTLEEVRSVDSLEWTSLTLVVLDRLFEADPV